MAWQPNPIGGPKARIPVPKVRKPGKKITAEQYALTLTEHAQQVAVFIWASEPDTLAAMPEIKWLHAIPNGGERHIAVATRMVAEGAKSGVYDIFWPCPRYWRGSNTIRYCGLYVEMKKPANGTKRAGRLSNEQEQFKVFAEAQGYFTAEAWTLAEAQHIIMTYYKIGT